MSSRPPRSHRVFVLFIVLAFSGCKHDPVSGPLLQQPPVRAFRLGFSGYPPRFDLNLAVAAINMWLTRSDAAIISG